MSEFKLILAICITAAITVILCIIFTTIIITLFYSDIIQIITNENLSAAMRNWVFTIATFIGFIFASWRLYIADQQKN